MTKGEKEIAKGLDEHFKDFGGAKYYYKPDVEQFIKQTRQDTIKECIKEIDKIIYNNDEKYNSDSQQFRCAIEAYKSKLIKSLK